MRVGRVQEAADAADPGVGQQILQDDARLRRVAVVQRVLERACGMEGPLKSRGHSASVVAAAKR